METMKKKLLEAFERGEHFTNAQANNYLISTEGGRIIRFLRADGVPIRDEWRENKLRKGSRIKVYWLDKVAWNQIKKERKEFEKAS